MTPDQMEPGPRQRRSRGPWIAALLVLLALIVAAGVVTAVITGDDDGDDLTQQVQGAADDGIDAVTGAGDDALDTVTGQAGEAVDGITGDSGTAPQAVQDDPLVQQLAQGRELPFVAGPWERRAYRDGVWDRLSDATRARAERIEQNGAFAIRIQ